MRSVAIIPARGGSVRIPGKNMKLFHGKPIIQYSIEAAKKAGFDQIVVSSDWAACLTLAKSLDVTPLIRAAKFAQQEVGTQEVAKHVLSHFPGFDLACVIYATAPMISIFDLMAARRDLVEMNVPYVYSVDDKGQDAGQFYWGWVDSFMNDIPLDGPKVIKYRVDPRRVCDINTPEDFSRAERMYIEGGFHEQ